MALYSLNGALPAPIPARVRLSNGLTRTGPSTYTSEEISEWGYIGPIDEPAYDPSIEAIFWSEADAAYLVRQLVAEEIEANRLQELRSQSNYLVFWDALMASTVYGAIREQSFVSLPVNTLATEFIALLGDAKAGRPNETAIQASMDAILATGTFTTAQLTELQTALVAGHLEGIYTLV
jgi:hypothetical protein